MPLLEVQSLVKNFGGLKANDDISFTVEKGELIGLIGPNGAGKTTLFNCVSGLHPVSSGKVAFAGEDITSLKAHDIARRGLARTRSRTGPTQAASPRPAGRPPFAAALASRSRSKRRVSGSARRMNGSSRTGANPTT